MMLYFLNEQESPKASNKGVWVDKFNRYCKVYAAPWCASVQSNMADMGKVIYPRIKSARAKDFAQGKTHSLNQINFGIYVPKCGDYRVKSRRGGHHVDVFLSWDKDKKEGYVIGGNVSDKVTMRKVTLQSMIADGTTHITDVTGYYDYSLPEDSFSKWLSKYGSVRTHKGNE